MRNFDIIKRCKEIIVQNITRDVGETAEDLPTLENVYLEHATEQVGLSEDLKLEKQVDATFSVELDTYKNNRYVFKVTEDGVILDAQVYEPTGELNVEPIYEREHKSKSTITNLWDLRDTLQNNKLNASSTYDQNLLIVEYICEDRLEGFLFIQESAQTEGLYLVIGRGTLAIVIEDFDFERYTLRVIENDGTYHLTEDDLVNPEIVRKSGLIPN